MGGTPIGRVITASERDEELLPESNGSVRVLVDGRVGSRNVLLRVFRFGPGRTPELSNPSSEDVMYVVEGQGEARVAGAGFDLSPGTGLFVPVDVTYEISNPGPHDLVLVSVLSPPPGADPPEGVEEEDFAAGAAAVVHEDDEPVIPAGPDRMFKLLVDPRVGCRSATQFVGWIEQSGAPRHRHTYEEAIYVLGGRGVAHIDGRGEELTPGTAVFLQPGVAHSLECTSRDPLRILGVFSPAGSPASREDLPA